MNRRREALERLQRVGPALRRAVGESERRADFLARFGGVTLHQMGALRHLVNLGPLSMNELAARMEISPSAATALVDRLIQHGLAERHPDAADRRLLRVAVSGTAADAVRTFERETRQRLAAMLAPLSQEEIELLASLAERIVEATTAEQPPRREVQKP